MRPALERASARPLLFLRGLPRWLPPLLLAGLLVAGLALPGWLGAAALVVIAVFLAWLAALSWPARRRAPPCRRARPCALPVPRC